MTKFAYVEFHDSPAKVVSCWLRLGFGGRNQPSPRPERGTTAMQDDTLLPFALPAVGRKKVSASFDGGRITSDGGAVLLSLAERRLAWRRGLRPRVPIRATPRAWCIPWPTSCARMLAIACGYEDAGDIDRQRHNPALKLA